MKLVRSFVFLVVLLALAFGAIPATAQDGSEPLMPPASWPCVLPAGATAASVVDAASTPRLLSDAEIAVLLPSMSPPPPSGLLISWAWAGWTVSAANVNEVIYAGLWGLPQNSALTLDGGRGAIVSVLAGTVDLLACGADGEYDQTEGDAASNTLGAGSSTSFAAGSSVYVFLGSSPTTYWLFGTPDAGISDAVVAVQIVGNNGGPQTCGPTTCWPAPVQPGASGATACADLGCAISGPPGGCSGMRCWVP